MRAVILVGLFLAAFAGGIFLTAWAGAASTDPALAESVSPLRFRATEATSRSRRVTFWLDSSPPK